MALPLFAVTLFVSAFVLFLVQPMVGKMILPKLGGTPQVWNTCMVFFQSALLAGYAYAHYISTRLPVKRQILVHSIVLLIPIILLVPPIGPFNVAGWTPPAGGNPIFDSLRLLAIVVGLPFFAVSTTAPLLQKWFSRTGHETSQDPYYLYSASNIGSLLSLVAYPFIVEPALPLSTQTVVWAVSYVLLVGLIISCALLLAKTPGTLELAIAGPEVPTAETPVPPQPEPAPGATSTAVKAGPAPAVSKGFQKKKLVKGAPSVAKTADIAAPAAGLYPSEAPVTGWRRLRWVFLAAIPSSLMLGVTSYVSTDLSPFPLIWAIPLCLYLISFILVFSRWPTQWTGTPHDVVLFLERVGLAGLAFLLLAGFNGAYMVPMFVAFGGFFLVALACHGELARDRPSPRHLTEFFLLMSFGGMLGGIFNGILAPLLFTWVVEFPLAIIVACFLRPITRARGWTEDLIVNNFPNAESWAVQKGDELAARFNKPAPRTPYILSWIFDVIHGIVTVVLVFFVIRFLFGRFIQNRPFTETTLNFMKLIGWDEPTRASAEAVGRLVFLIVPLAIICAFGSRPVRFGLGLFTLLWLYVGFLGVPPRDHLPDGAKRTYFGVLRVFENPGGEVLNKPTKGNKFSVTELREPELMGATPAERKRILGIDFDPLKQKELLYGRSTSLTHGTTHHGQNFHYPPGLRRLATTYYHRMGPVGAVMERYNWFEKQEFLDDLPDAKPGKDGKKPERRRHDKEKHNGQHRYTADARLPAAMVGQGFTSLDVGLPIDQIGNVFSEPPIATIGLGTGTMASYGRPYQHVVFYEIDDEIRRFSEPYLFKEDYSDLPSSPKDAGWMLEPDGKIEKPYFTYLRDASMRGSQVEVIMGDARLSMEQTLKPGMTEELLRKMLTRYPDARYPFRQNYYKVIEVDAFSSDAIPVHLITKEAIQVYLEHLADDGVINVHTSNRHVDLVQPVVNIAASLGLDWRVGKDIAPKLSVMDRDQDALGHTGSEYVMLAKKPGILKDLYGIPGEGLARKETVRLKGNREIVIDATAYENQPVGRSTVGWSQPHPPDHRIWTDDYSNIMQIYR